MKDFDWEKYLNYYDDLRDTLLNKETAINHWNNHGQYENRIYFKKYFDDFDWEKYLNYYDDLRDILLNKETVINHWNNYGQYENRIYFRKYNKKLVLPNDFNWFEYINLYDDLKKNIFNEKDAITHYLTNGINECRNYKTNNIINSIDIISKTPNTNNYSNDIIISMASIPSRFISNSFLDVIDSINNQVIKPLYIVINLCNTYKRFIDYDKTVLNKRIDFLKERYDNIIINFSEDYGPITKILGLYHLDKNIKISDNSKIIIIDDDWKYINYLVYYYDLVYSLYNCDAVFIDEQHIIDWNKNMKILNYNEIFYDNYQSIVYGWLSFSIKYKFIKKIYTFYNEIIKIKTDIFKHDDLILTIFYKINKLYTCGINIFMNIHERLELENINALRNENDVFIFRYNLEKYFFDYYNINCSLNKDNKLSIVKNKDYDYNFIIDNNIEIRKNLFNVNNVVYLPELNDFHNKHLDIKYFNENVFILTITNFNNNNVDINNIVLNINNTNTKINIYSILLSNKKTYFIKTNNLLSKIEHKKYNFNIFQTNNTNNLSINKYYSILTILSYLPDINYIFFNDENRINYINNYNYKLLYIYNKLNVGAYKSDFFRALYIYLNGGIYFDCKNILFKNINYLLEKNECYAKDKYDGICNGFIYCSTSYNNNFKKYINEMIYNIHNSLYLSSSLEITGPILFGKFIHNNIYIKNTFHNDDWINSYFTDINTNDILIKISYYNYYVESNYLNTNHYSIIYNNKLVYKESIHYNKINFIDHILWINLDRSSNRMKNMINILSNINIPNTRISAIDGKYEDVRSYVNIDYERNMSQYEIACTLSHIKAINYLNNFKGEYFMICEDDVSFNNINLFRENLENIIINCPSFDILLLSKIFNLELTELYTDWNNYIDNKNIQIAGTGCYIISRNGINNIIKNASYNYNTFNFTNKKFDVADMYLYKKLKTYVYKYDFIGIQGYDSTIHSDHVGYQNDYLKIQNKIIINNLF